MNDTRRHIINRSLLNDSIVINWVRYEGTLVWYLFREIGDCEVGLLMGIYETKTEARMDLWQYEKFTNYKYNIKNILTSKT